MYSDVYEKAARDQIPYHAFIEWDRSLDFIVLDCITNNLNDAAIRGLWTIENAFEWNFEHNMPAEDEIWEFRHDKYGKEAAGPPGTTTDQSLQWHYVSTELISSIGRLGTISVKNENDTVASTCLYCLSIIIDKVIKSECGELQKDRIISWCEYFRKTIAEAGIDSRRDSGRTYLNSYDGHHFNRYIEERPHYAKTYLNNFAQQLRKAAGLRILDYMVINEMGFIARSSIHDVDNSPPHADTVTFICDLFDELRSIIEENYLQEESVIYRTLFQQVQGFGNWMAKDNQKNTIVQKKINSTIANFSAGLKQLDEK